MLTSIIGNDHRCPAGCWGGAGDHGGGTTAHQGSRSLGSWICWQAVPSVVYGLLGIFALIPAIKPVVDFLTTTLGTVPVIGVAFQGPFFGVSYFSAGWCSRSWSCRSSRRSAVKSSEVRRATRKRRAGSWGDTLGDDPHCRAATGTLRHRRRIAPGTWPSVRRDHRGDHGHRQCRAAHQREHLFARGDDVERHRHEFTEATEPFHLSALFVVGFWLLIVALVVNIVARLVVRRGVAL